LFNSIKYLLIILLISPFPSLSNSLFQKIDLKLNKNITLNDENNIEKKLINILDFNSKYVVNFWATWCIPCKKELPDLNKMKIDNKDLNIIIISIDKKPIKDQLNFLAKNKVIVTASLPCYEKNNVDFQRGFGVFEKSINAIKILNDLGYGKKEKGLKLNLVYNPVRPILPPSQEILEKDYKKILFEKYNIVFNNLYTITNMPINRYEESLKREGKLNTYYKLLKENFNEKNLENLMCKKTISVNWLGEIYDCDFNQQINFRENKGPKTLFDLLDESFTFDYRVSVKEHCLACTAGAGSSCGWTLS